jgi:methylglutaconyl-CoA hydratase
MNQKEPNFLDLHLINAMRSCSKLIVGRIHGKAVGGVGIASACDYAMAKNASIKLSERYGIGPFVIEPVVTKIEEQLWPK